MLSKPRAIHHMHERAIHHAQLSGRARHGSRGERQARKRRLGVRSSCAARRGRLIALWLVTRRLVTRRLVTSFDSQLIILALHSILLHSVKDLHQRSLECASGNAHA